MMTITVLAFGVAREILESGSVSMQCSEEMTVGALKTQLEQLYPRLKQLTSFMVAVNNEYAGPEQNIGEHDEIAIIPPVSGG
jgi:molybdopterin synthase sulfur carrier subunit